MRAVILAGGLGSRLSGSFPDIPKSLVELNAKPVVQYQMENLQRYGISDIMLLLSHRAEQIQAYLGNGSRYGVNISYFTEPSPLGTAVGLYYLQEYLTSDFILLYGDLILDIDFTRLMDFHVSHRALATLAAHPNNHPYDSDLLVVDNCGQVKAILDKNQERRFPYRNYVNAGVFVLNNDILKYLAKDKKQDLERDLIRPLIPGNRIYAYRSSEYIKDMGTPERYLMVENHIKEGIVSSKNLSRKQKAVFLDRDGTINNYVGLVSKPEQLVIPDEVYQAIKLINDSGYLCIVITNQPVVARNLCSIEELENIHARLETTLGEKGVYLDDILYCPHHPDKGYPEENPAFKTECDCRKPKTGLIDLALQKYNIDPLQSYFIGDTTTDIQTGYNAGLKTVLLSTGLGGTDGKYNIAADYHADSLLMAIQNILYQNSLIDFTANIRSYLHDLKVTIDSLNLSQINTLLNELLDLHSRGGVVYIFGNGGSASTASHFVVDFNKGVSEKLNRRFRMVCLNDNVPSLSAIANDIGYEQVFKFQLENYLQAGDLVIGISGSGNSKNVTQALEYANTRGIKTFALVGYDGGLAKKVAQHVVHVPIKDMQKVEDIHLILDHLMMKILKEYMEGLELGY